jgi:hypothetical protein
MNSLRETAVVALLLLLGASLVPAYAQQAEPAEEEPSDLWSYVQALYEKAKAAGEQVPGTTIEWIREDLDKVGDWEYRVVSLGGSAEQVEKELNELGRERWECFWVQQEGRRVRFFLKRPARSYLSSIPVTSLMKLLPSLGVGDSAE